MNQYQANYVLEASAIKAIFIQQFDPNGRHLLLEDGSIVGIDSSMIERRHVQIGDYLTRLNGKLKVIAKEDFGVRFRPYDVAEEFAA